ncbi:MAG TPA: protein kinase [Terriglobales bacterium]|nr:protein kinase [Terriglobales bacterium]
MAAARKAPLPFPFPDDLSGHKVGRFVVRHKLGCGGMGEVYYAEDTKLRRPVALKRVAGTVGSDPEARQHILREAQRASALSSEHIAAVHDVLEQDDGVLLVMEYVEGETLRQRLRKPIDLEQFFEIAMQCAKALIAAHEHGIIHCDIKPENIMLTPSGQVKILDFGVAKHLPRSDQSSTLDSKLLGGTPAYMSPEVLLEKVPDARSDLFSLGIVFYEMLTLRNPFLTGSFITTSERILHETPSAVHIFNPHVPAGLEVVVMKAMAKAAEERYANATELLEDLRRVQAGEMPTKAAQTTREFGKRQHWGIAAVALVLLIVFPFAAYHWTHRPPILAERGWILITDFEITGDDSIPGEGVREGLTVALQQSRYVNVFPRTRAFETLQRMKKAEAPRIDEALGREICRRENLQVLLAGSIERLGQAFQITVRGVDPVRGNLLFAEQERFDRKELVFEKVDGVAKSVRRDLGESLTGIGKNSRPLAKVTTSSLDALQLYSQAKDAKDQGKDEQIEGLLKGALRLDPNFAMAHLQMGEYYAAVVGRNEKALGELESAYQLRREVSAREQYRIEAAYYDLQERPEDKAQSLRVLVGLYPDDEEAHTELASAYYDLDQLDKAISESREALRLNPASAPAYGGLVLYLARDNRADDAILAAREAEHRGVGSPRMHWGLGLAYLGQGNVSRARQEFGQIGDDTETNRDLRELCATVADLYQGKLSFAENELETKIEAVPPQSGGLQLFRRYLLGRIYLLQGRARKAELQADLLMQVPVSGSQGGDFLNAGILYARANRFAKAQQALNRLDELQKATASSSNVSDFRNLEGEILLAEGESFEAETALSASTPAFLSFMSSAGLARAYQGQGNWERAAAAWEKVLDKKGEILQNGFPPDLAFAHVELARAYRQINNHNLARQHYEDALRMWQHGDELNWLWDAKRELNSLAAEANPHINPTARPTRAEDRP